MVGKASCKQANRATPPASLFLRIVLSVLLFIHLAAVFFPPFTFATASGPGTVSPFAEPILSVLRPYVDLMFLDHGYFFFAPNPGPSHLLRAKLEFADGRPALELTFPDLKAHWPRLLYHRHFMLAEQLHSDFAVPEPPPGVANDPEQLASWRQARNRYELRRDSFKEHLREAYGASEVTLTRVEHLLLGPGEFRESGKSLNAADSYRDLPEDSTPLPPFPGSSP
jgi:hypothetical protein